MTFDVHPIEAAWVIVNLATFAFTLSAFVDARADRSAVKLLNGHARELIANGTVRREGIRVTVQLLLLSVVAPGLFSDRDIALSLPIVALMTVPVLLLLSSFFDARDRKALTVIVAADIVSDASKRFDRLEDALVENTRISQQASDHADKAYHEANSVNEKIASHGAVLVQQGEDMAADRARNAQSADTIDTTAEEVHDLHEGVAPAKEPS